jgi:hypothetical protein
MFHEHYINPAYQRVMDKWQKPLEKKKINREKRLQNPRVANED